MIAKFLATRGAAGQIAGISASEFAKIVGMRDTLFSLSSFA